MIGIDLFLAFCKDFVTHQYKQRMQDLPPFRQGKTYLAHLILGNSVTDLFSSTPEFPERCLIDCVYEKGDLWIQWEPQSTA